METDGRSGAGEYAAARRAGLRSRSSMEWYSNETRWAPDARNHVDHPNHHRHHPHQRRISQTAQPNHVPPMPTFFTPSYLKSSRHLQRLHQSHTAMVAGMEAAAARTIPARTPALSASSSNTNLNKAASAHSHRGVMHDVVERVAPMLTDERRPHPLPSRWNEDDKMTGLEILADGTEVRFNGITKNSDEAAAVRSDHPMPKECGIYYYEVTVLSRGKDGLIGIGFSGKKADLNRLPGWEAESWAYHGDDGNVFSCTSSGKAYGPHFGMQDVIGCGVNFRTGTGFFTKNGNYLGPAFMGLKADHFYPSIGMKKPGEHLRVNFGRTPFVFDIDQMVEQERRGILNDINQTSPANLHPPDDENRLLHNLVAQYLVHEGYIETAKAFTQDVQEREQSFAQSAPSKASQPRPFRPTNEEDDIHALNRQRIRRSILEGDIDNAISYTNTYYPRVLADEQNKDIYFRLKCHKFIEMMRNRQILSAQGEREPAVLTKKAAGKRPVVGNGGNRNGHSGVLLEKEDSIDEDEDDRGDEEEGEESEDEDDEEEEEDEDDEDFDSSQQDDNADTQMELDDQLHREASRHLPSSPGDDIDMDSPTSSSPNLSPNKSRPHHHHHHAKRAIATTPKTLTSLSLFETAALQYGSELSQEYHKDRRPHIEQHLKDVFAVVAYPDVHASPLAHLFDTSRRVRLAEEVNGAILVSLGKPSSAALENLCAQTDALLDLLAPKGGPAAFVNVSLDYLRD